MEKGKRVSKIPGDTWDLGQGNGGQLHVLLEKGGNAPTSSTLQVNTVITGDQTLTSNGTPFSVTVGTGYTPDDYKTGLDNSNYTYTFVKAERNSDKGLFKLTASISNGTTYTDSKFRQFFPASGENVVTVYYTAKSKAAPTPKPDKPTANDIPGIVGNGAVQVHCTNSTANHTEISYSLKPNSYTVSEVEGDATNGYTCTITVQSDEYVSAYNKTYSGHTLDGSPTGTIKLKWNENKWKVDSGVPVVFNVKCENQTPDKPNPPEPENTSKPFIELTGEKAVKVKCTTAEATHADIEKSYGLKPGSYTIGNVEVTAEGGYTCDITVRPEQYVADYVSDPGHTLDPTGQTGTITLKWEPNLGNDGIGTWKVDRGVPVEFKVVCAPVVDPSKPEKPSDDEVKTLLGGVYVVTIDCTNDKVTHENKTYGLLTGGFSVGDVEGDKENGYTVNVTVTPDAYVTQYSKDIDEKHNLSPEEQGNLIITLKCKGKGSAWEIVPFTTKTYTVVCETGVTDKVTVSFDSNGGTAVAPQTINKGEKATRPANPTMDGYTFVNWYLDGEVYDFNTPVTEDITLHAQWKKNDDNPGQDPNPDPSPKPSPKPNPGGHDHGGSTVVVPITVYMPPKTGDMPFWYSIAQFFGLVK